MTTNTVALIEKSEISGFIIERTAKRMKQTFQRMLKAQNTGITVDQWVILQDLMDNDGRSQFELAQSTYKDAPTVTRIIDILVEKDLIKRVPDPDDRRKFNIFLTNAGQAKIEEVLPIVKQFRAVGWNGLSDRALNDMMRTLNTIFYNLKK